MSNWVKERADGVRLAERLKKEDFDRKSAASAELKSQLAPFWKDMISTLRQAVQEFNSEFPEAERMIDHFDTPAEDTLSIRRTAYPAVTVKAQLNNAGTTVQYAISRTQRKGMNTVEKQASFAFAYVDGQPVYVEPTIRNHEDLAKLLLDSFFEF